MHVLSNAFFSQAEVTQPDRWDYGPLEIHLVPEPTDVGHAEFGGRVVEWNQGQTAGFVRSETSLATAQRMGFFGGRNPNVVIAPTRCGYSELLGMLGSLLPTEILDRFGINRPTSSFWLWPLSEELATRRENLDRCPRDELDRLADAHLSRLASIVPAAFE